jgi:hypothetical protein
MKVFVDLHHSDLYYSLHLLLEKRLGFELYRPVGMDWFNEGYWKIATPYNNNLSIVKQFLNIDIEHPERYHPKCGYYNVACKNDIYYVYEPIHDYYQKAITLETFKNTKFDLIISTVQDHDSVFELLRNKYQPSAKIISQLGNVGQKTNLDNVFHSVTYNAYPYQNSVLIHQEIDTNLYKFTPINPDTKNIYSVVNLAAYIDVYSTYKNQLTECNFKYYGINSPDGILDGTLGVSQKMIEANMGWCLKHLGGLGHSNMGWCYSGRPIVTNMSQHRFFGGVALQLFEPDVTCIDIESGNIESNAKKMRDWLIPENSIKYGEKLRNRFLELVNYDEEELKFRKFLSNII